MPGATKVLFRGESFPTKTSLMDYIRPNIYAMPLYMPLDGFALDIAQGVLDIHPNRAEKVGCGVATIGLRLSPRGQRELWITRTDGTEDVYSWAQITHAPKNDRYYIHAAFREAIEDQIKKFRRDYFAGTSTPICAITGKPLVNDPSTHVDHELPRFVEIADEFITLSGGTCVIPWSRAKTTAHAAILTDPEQAARWAEFHKKAAVLRPTTRRANLSRKDAEAA